MSETVAIIVTFNRQALLLACLDALAAQTAACDVLVVDNASTDGTADAVRPRLREGFSYVNTGANLGGAGGFAFGISEALRQGYERLWIMDDDVLPAPDALERLLEADGALGDGVGWLSSKCLLPSGDICPMNRQRSTPYAKIPDVALSGAEPVPAQMATFVSLFFRAESVRRFGLPISEFFIWCDDLEWTRRVSRERPCYVVPESVVTHAITGSAASNVAVDAPARIPRYFYAFRNELFVYRREGLRGLAYYFAKVALNAVRVLLRARGRRIARLRALFSGLVAGLSFCPKPSGPRAANVFFSVITPTYNRARSICTAVDSILRQTFRDFELIVADDGSTDGTAELLSRRYAAELASGRIRVLELPHGGVCAARNAALEASSGTWIAYLDSDNEALPEFLQTFADGIRANPEARNFYAALVRREAGTVLDEPFSRTILLKWNFIDIGVYCHHRDLVAEFGGFDPAVCSKEDWDLVIRHSAKYQPVRLGRVVLRYSDESGGDRLTTIKLADESSRTLMLKHAPAPADVDDRDLAVVESSPFFDGEWYARSYGRMLDGEDPAHHYLSIGWRIGCDPGPVFSGLGYLKNNRDVAEEDVNPLLHYERHGRAEGRVGFLRRRGGGRKHAGSAPD